MVKSSERVLSEHGSRLRVRAAHIEGKPDLADPPERSKVLPPSSRPLPSCFEQLRQLEDGALVGRRRHEPRLNRATELLYGCTTGAWGTVSGAFPLLLGYVYRSLAGIWLPLT